MTDVLEDLFAEIAQNQRDVVIATLYSWTVAVRLFQNADHELLNRFSDHAETQNHKWTLNALIRLGQFCEMRLGTIVDKDLNDYQMSRVQILADLGELEQLAEERKDNL